MKTLYALDKNGNVVFSKLHVLSHIDKTVDIITGYGRLGGKRQEKVVKIKKGKNIGKANETTPLQQAQLEAESKWLKKKDEGYKTLEEYQSKSSFVKSPEDIGKHFKYNTFPNWSPMPMLAEPFKEKLLKGNPEFFIQPKLNGVRGIGSLGNLISRGGKEYNIPHIQKDIDKLINDCNNKGIILDGEIYLHGTPLQEIVSLVKNADKPKRKDLVYVVYDVINPDLFYKDRVNTLAKIKLKTQKLGINSIKLLEVNISKIDRYKAWHDKYVTNGYEGAIIRLPNSVYMSGFRDKALIKVKEFIDEEFTITGHICEKDDIDSFVFVLEQEEGKTFKARPRGTRQDKLDYLNSMEAIVGKQATVRYQERTVDNVPHQAHVVVIRDYE